MQKVLYVFFGCHLSIFPYPKVDMRAALAMELVSDSPITQSAYKAPPITHDACNDVERGENPKAEDSADKFCECNSDKEKPCRHLLFMVPK